MNQEYRQSSLSTHRVDSESIRSSRHQKDKLKKTLEIATFTTCTHSIIVNDRYLGSSKKNIELIK